MKFAHNIFKFSKFAQHYMNDKTFEKNKHQNQSTSALNFSQFEELQILGPNLPKKYE